MEWLAARGMGDGQGWFGEGMGLSLVNGICILGSIGHGDELGSAWVRP